MLRHENIDRFRAKIKKHPLISGVLFLSLFAVIYWGLIASDRYVSEAHVIIQSTDSVGVQSMDFASLLGSVGAGSGSDQMLLQDHLLSVDMLKKLDEKLDLRAHFSDSRRDLLSRLWAEDISIEWFYKYYLKRVSIEYDDNAGVLIIKSEAYDPEMAFAISSMLLESGEQFMNSIAHDLAKVQVEFLEKAVVQMSARVMDTRHKVLDFQDKKGLVSPENSTKNLVGIINAMESRLSEFQAARAAMLSYLMADSPNIVEMDMQIKAVEKQISREKAKLTSTKGKTLNKIVEEYQRLQLNAQFAQDVYKSALVSLEKGRIDAARTLKKMSVLQMPTQPEYPLLPTRIYNIVVFIVFTFLISGIISLLIAIIADHKD